MRTNSTASTPRVAVVTPGAGAPNAPTETAREAAIMPSGRSNATSAHRIDTRPSEKPSRTCSSSRRPSANARLMAAMLGPAMATTLRTRPAGVAILIDVATMTSQIPQEIANVSAKKASSCREISTEAAYASAPRARAERGQLGR
jgi:hypothetical protein